VNETALLARLADSIRTLCNAVTDMMKVKEHPEAVRELLNTKAELSAGGKGRRARAHELEEPDARM